jgi:hypothetical protein
MAIENQVREGASSAHHIYSLIHELSFGAVPDSGRGKFPRKLKVKFVSYFRSCSHHREWFLDFSSGYTSYFAG